MDNPFVRLIKVLDLERKQGYRNKAVIGGLDKFASRWENEARAASPDLASVNQIVALLIGYPAVDDVTARERILDQIQRCVHQIAEGGALPVSEVPTPPALPSSTARQPERSEPAAPPAVVSPAVASETTPEGRPDVAPRPYRPEVARPTFRRNSEVDRPPTARPAPEPEARAPRPAPVHQAAPAAEETKSLDAPVTVITGVGPVFAEKLERLGILTVRDLIYHLPTRYEDYSALRTIDRLRPAETVSVIGTVWKVGTRPLSGDRHLTTASVGDGTGEMIMTWFNNYVDRQLHIGRAYIFSGTTTYARNHLEMTSPEFEPLDRNQLHTGRIVPIYRQTQGVSTHWLRGVISKALEVTRRECGEFLPEAMIQSSRLMPLGKALLQVHFPDNPASLSEARRRLAFEEFLVLQLGVLTHRRRWQALPGRALNTSSEMLQAYLGQLPFALTKAQEKATGEILADLGKPQPMSRLLQGDVGSGKTAVAGAALWSAVANGTQAALMAPTELLAEQHGQSLSALFDGLRHPLFDRPVSVRCITGRLSRAEREQALAGLAAGQIDIAIGTQALIQEGVAFRELTVAIVDEQHRFGVEQRAALREKGVPPHVLVMSATPIPRSLALTLYGDLDVSVLNEMPSGRIPVRTKWLRPTERERAYSFIKAQAAAGSQAFIVYPLVESAEASEALAATEECERLQRDVFPELRLGLLHGRMRGDEKERVMAAFSQRDLDVLITTSVVEVGIDIPNATVIMIEGAEHFGLAQLHQFRGRVGRGKEASYCILISSTEAASSVQRLQALENSNDGFALAQIDLDMRGPGDFLGTRQSGLPPLHAAEIGDLTTLQEGRSAAQALLSLDPFLELPEHRALAERVTAFWQAAGDLS
jgi:ATP-dependent DNA helicase RecG